VAKCAVILEPPILFIWEKYVVRKDKNTSREWNRHYFPFPPSFSKFFRSLLDDIDEDFSKQKSDVACLKSRGPNSLFDSFFSFHKSSVHPTSIVKNIWR
jgi:hypothetical protein